MKIVIFTVESIYSYLLLKRLFFERTDEIKAIYISKLAGNNSPMKFFKKKILNGPGFKYYIYKYLYETFYKKKSQKIKTIAKKNKIPIFYIDDINKETIVKNIVEINPTVIISAYFNQIIKLKLLEIPTFGILNVHPSLLPEYRGVKPIFWVLLNNEKKTGITIHLMDSGIDTGDIIIQKEIEIEKSDSLNSLTIKLSNEGSEMLNQVLFDIKNNTYSLIKQNNEIKSYYSQPTKNDIKEFRKLRKFY